VLSNQRTEIYPLNTDYLARQKNATVARQQMYEPYPVLNYLKRRSPASGWCLVSLRGAIAQLLPIFPSGISIALATRRIADRSRWCNGDSIGGAYKGILVNL